MSKSNKTADDSCSFCGRTRKEVLVLVQGEDVAICEGCTLQANKIVEEELGGSKVKSPKKKKTPLNKSMKPRKINECLDHYVIGQDEAKKTLSVAVYINTKD